MPHNKKMTATWWNPLAYSGEGGIRLTVYAFCTALLALMWLALFHQISYEREHALQKREAENDNLARLFEENVLRTLAAAGVTLKQVESDYRRHGGSIDLARYLNDRREDLKPYSLFSVVDEHGDLRASSVPIPAPMNFRPFENFQTHSRDASPEVYVSTPRVGTLTGNPTIYLSSRMNKADGSFGGYTVIGMDPGYFSRLYSQIELGMDSVIALIGRDGVVRARQSNSSAPQPGAGLDVSRSPLFRDRGVQPPGGKFRATSPVDGVARLYSYRTVQGHPLVVLVGSSEAATRGALAGRTTFLVWTAGAASLVILGFAALLLRQMSRVARVSGELRLSRERYAIVEHATNDGIWDINLQTGESYLSARGREILGFGDEETQVSEAEVFHRVHPDDAHGLTHVLAESTRSGSPYQVEYRVRQADGGYRWVLSRGEMVRDEEGSPRRLVRSIADVTERKNYERHYREQSRVLDLIFRHSLDCIALLDRDFNFLRVSDSYAKACAREASAFVGRSHFELFPSDFEQEIEPFRQEKRTYSRSARPFVFPDHPEWGTTYWDIGLVPILGEDREIELFLFTLNDVTERVRSEHKAADYMARMRALSGRLVAVQEEERRTLARELHDEVGQGLTAVKIRLQAMRMTFAGGGAPGAAENFDETLALVATILEQVRSLSLDLRPMLLDELGLAAALKSLVERSAAAAGWVAHVNEDMPGERLDHDVELACYRVAQEAMTNVMRHSGATEIWVTLRRGAHALLLTVRDNGCGFDPASAQSAEGLPHLGLHGMEERVLIVAGRFEIRSGHGEGTEVRASFPVAEAVADGGAGS